MVKNHATLYLVVDAIPYSTALRVWNEGWLQDTERPRRLVATFPSETFVALTGLMRGLDPGLTAPGFEERYYDIQEGRIHGGILDKLLDAENATGYAKHFSVFENSVIDKMRIYAFPERAALHDIRVIRRHMINEAQGFWCGYIGATDGAGHMGGEGGQEELFRKILKHVQDLKETYQRENSARLDVVMMSDHGFSFEFDERLTIEEVRDAFVPLGFRIAERCEKRGDVVLCPWGMVGAGGLYCLPEDCVGVARTVIELPQVDLAIANSPEEGLRIFRKRGASIEEARADCSPDHSRFRYEPISGDPLDMAHLWEQLAMDGHTDPKGFVEEFTLFSDTWNASYPDVLYRLFDCFKRVVLNPPGVAISMKDRTAFGSDAAWRASLLLGGLRGTHGNLARAQSHGFLLTSFPLNGVHADAVRYDQALRATILSGELTT